MKKHNIIQKVSSSVSAVLLTFLCGITAFADTTDSTASTVQASQDLFSSNWTVGNLFEIQGLVNFLGNIAVIVISAVGFGIVIFSILKNAISGLYVVNPPFWDRVDDIKKELIDGVGSGINSVGDHLGKASNASKKLGGLLTTVLGWIPNIKSLTDFEGDEAAAIDKKQYFVKSIPLLVAQIFIGALIFMGYPTKIASWIASGGTSAINAVLNNIDPVEVVSSISDQFVIYNLTTDNSQDPFEQNINDAARAVASSVYTKYDDMEKQPKQAVALEIENMLIQAFDNESIRNVLGSADGYKFNCSALSTTIQPTVSSAYSDLGNNVKCSTSSSGTVSYVWYVNGTSLSTGSAKASSEDWFQLNITATPIALSNVGGNALVVFGGFDSNQISSNVQTKEIKVPISNITFGSGNDDIHGALGKTITATAIKVDGSTVSELHSYQCQIQGGSVGQTMGATAFLVFSNSVRETLATDLAECSYLRLNVPDGYTYPINVGKNVTSLRIVEFRLTSGGSKSFGLNSWSDFNATSTEGKPSLSAQDLASTSSTGIN